VDLPIYHRKNAGKLQAEVARRLRKWVYLISGLQKLQSWQGKKVEALRKLKGQDTDFQLKKQRLPDKRVEVPDGAKNASKERDMEEVKSVSILADEILLQISFPCPSNFTATEWQEASHRFIVERFNQAINKATQRERERIDSLCRQLEFTNNFMKTRIEDSLTLRALLKDNQELVDQVRLER